ncbi:MAG: UTP--glucose-1-phosphate uridylyltransferase GalU [Proteobacteria bacterium]|nr:UTP--glucose-1-phosphate uridylyltransferase GalU [Pseudomonadota bacterium]
MKVRKALFPAAGMGTRFLPITKAIPKEMLPLVDKPLIQYCVEEAMAAAIKEIIIITGMGKTAIEDHFDTSFQLETILKNKGKLEELKVVQDVSNMLHFSYTRQKEAKGLGHAVLVGRNLIGNEPFAVFLGDDIVNATVPCMKQMIDVYNEKGCSVLAVKKVPRDEVSQYGVIAGEKVGDRLYRVLDMVEKPSVEDAPSDLAIIGRYLLMPEIFDHIEVTPPGRGGEIQLTDAMKSLLKDQPMYALEFEGDRYDAGDRLGFIKANIAFALERDELRDDVVKFIKGLNLK